MGERVKEITRYLQKEFPKLVNDSAFKITSKATHDYNCIAWAICYQDRWIQPPIGIPNLDSVTWWPPDVPDGVEPEFLKKLFESYGFEVCASSEHEQGYRKVALYYKQETNEWTHAARELSNGYWTSKLGPSCDIQHGNPESIENKEYGKVYCIMKKKFS